MITFNLNNIARGETIRGGFTPIKVISAKRPFLFRSFRALLN